MGIKYKKNPLIVVRQEDFMIKRLSTDYLIS